MRLAKDLCRKGVKALSQALREAVPIRVACRKPGEILLLMGENPANSPVEVGDVEIPLFARLTVHLRWLAGFLNHQQDRIHLSNESQTGMERNAKKFNRSDRVSGFDMFLSDNLSLEGKLYHTKANRT